MLRKIVVGPYQANCYILGHEPSREGLVIDPGDEPFKIVEEISKLGLRMRFILLTHGHIDHIGGVKEIERITRAPVFIHAHDAPALGSQPHAYLHDGQQLTLGSYKLNIIYTPGHSPGGVCIHAPGAVFTGDTLFAGSVGRTDFQGGDHNQLVTSVIKKIFPLGDELRIYPGHGPASTIGKERATNPFFRFARTG
jgi:hydroxyacylglutathione hydrolase